MRRPASYAVRHPERVARLILHGGYAHGAFRRGLPNSETACQAMINLTRVAWGRDNPKFQSSLHIALRSGSQPRATAMVQRPLPQDGPGRGSRQTTRGACRGRLIRIPRQGAYVDARPARAQRRGDPACGRAAVAGSIPGAEFVELDSRTTFCSSTNRRGSDFARRAIDGKSSPCIPVACDRKLVRRRRIWGKRTMPDSSATTTCIREWIASRTRK